MDERTNTHTEDEDDHLTVSVPVVLLGFALMIEATLLLIGCIIALLFNIVFGLLGVLGSAALLWAGWLLAGLSQGDYRLASICTVAASILMAFGSLFLIALASCRSFVNCGSAQSDLAVFVIPATLGLFNLFCAAILWRRKHQRATRALMGPRPNGLK